MSNRSFLYWNWQRSAVVVVAVLAVIQLFRANRPAPPQVADGVPRYTTGTIVDAPVVVPAGEFVSYRMEFNRRTKVRGEFQTGSNAVKVEFLLLDERNFEAWKDGGEYRSVSETGYVPGGRLIRVVPPGTYHLVVSNRDAPGPPIEKTVRATFTAE